MNGSVTRNPDTRQNSLILQEISRSFWSANLAVEKSVNPESRWNMSEPYERGLRVVGQLAESEFNGVGR